MLEIKTLTEEEKQFCLDNPDDVLVKEHDERPFLVWVKIGDKADKLVSAKELVKLFLDEIKANEGQVIL